MRILDNVLEWAVGAPGGYEKAPQQKPVPQYSAPADKPIEKKTPNVVKMNSGKYQSEVVILAAENYDAGKDIAEHLRSHKSVVLNLEKLEEEVAKRILDFVSGSVYSLDANIQKVSRAIFYIAPHNVEITGDLRDALKTKSSYMR